MSEPKAEATRVEKILPNVYRWHLQDERIGGYESDAYAVVDDDGRVVLIDPLPVREQELRKLGEIAAIVLTAGNHQRSAWRYRRVFGVDVYAPENAAGLEEEPDLTYSGGEALPNGLVAFHTPGPIESMHALWMAGPHPVVFVSDLLAHDGSGVPEFMESAWQDEPARTRASVCRIVEQIPVEAVCFAHGPPILAGGARALREALDRDTEFPELHAP